MPNTDGDNDFFCSLNVYFNFSANDPGDGFDKLNTLNISVATPFGLAKYISKCVEKGLLPSKCIYPFVLFVDSKNEEGIEEFVKQELYSFYGKSETEILFKISQRFQLDEDALLHLSSKIR